MKSMFVWEYFMIRKMTNVFYATLKPKPIHYIYPLNTIIKLKK